MILPASGPDKSAQDLIDTASPLLEQVFTPLTMDPQGDIRRMFDNLNPSGPHGPIFQNALLVDVTPNVS
jgi:hypothetical protein